LVPGSAIYLPKAASNGSVLCEKLVFGIAFWPETLHPLTQTILTTTGVILLNCHKVLKEQLFTKQRQRLVFQRLLISESDRMAITAKQPASLQP